MQFFLTDLLAMPILQFESEAIFQNFIDSAQNHLNLDLSDLLIAHVAHAFDCQSILTLDKNASKFKYFELLK